jgi:hypothetical protein
MGDRRMSEGRRSKAETNPKVEGKMMAKIWNGKNIGSAT